jgi:hypothetical protein
MQKANWKKVNGTLSVLTLQKNGGCYPDIYSFCYIYRLYKQLHDWCNWGACIKSFIKEGLGFLFDA